MLEYFWWECKELGGDNNKCNEGVLMILKEGGFDNHRKQSNVYLQFIDDRVRICNKENWTANCKRERSFGYCQVHFPSHPEISRDKKFLSDKYHQMNYCARMWVNSEYEILDNKNAKRKKGVIWYGYVYGRKKALEMVKY